MHPAADACVKCHSMMEKTNSIAKLMSEWPETWQGVEADLAKGNEIVSVFSKFLDSLAKSGLARRTIRRHVDNLWLLGGEIIYDINIYPEHRSKTAFDLLDRAVDEEGGPLTRHVSSESEQKSFDATCKKLHAFLESERWHLTKRSSGPTCLSRCLRGKQPARRPAAERRR